MSATATFKPDDSTEESRVCQILILCENFAAYERAKDVCWRIVVQLADDLDFSFNCWNFYELSDPACMDTVVRASAASDVIMLSLRQPKLPSLAEAWLDNVAHARSKSEGVLALVLNEPVDSAGAVSKLVERLEHSARRLGMDFLSPALPANGFSIENSESLSARKDRAL